MKEGITPFPANGKFNPTKIERPTEDAVPQVEKVNEIRRVTHAIREAGEQPYLWGEASIHRTKQAISGFEYADIVSFVNRASEDQIRERPGFYIALLERIDELTPSAQDDE